MHPRFASLYLSLALFISTAAGAETANATPQTKCPAIKELLTTISQKKIFEQTPEAFLPTIAAWLSLSKDETKPLGPSEKLRTLEFSGKNPAWLNSGEATYTLIKDSATFNALSLDLNKNCFGTAKELIALASSTLGKGGKKITLPPPDNTEIILWRWKDPDINMTRSVEINASARRYNIEVKREPDLEGAGG